MGCDIHLYPEYRSRTTAQWEPFGKNMGWRDYTLFGFLAGVRGEGPPVVAPRGIPKDASTFGALSDHLLLITDNPEFFDSEGWVSRERAEEWLAKGWSTLWSDDRITSPDDHTPSWLTLEEYEEAVSRCETAYPEHGVAEEYTAIAAALRHLRDERGCEVRVVFWFDN